LSINYSHELQFLKRQLEDLPAMHLLIVDPIDLSKIDKEKIKMKNILIFIDLGKIAMVLSKHRP